jgi:hypothetical protein
MQTGLLHVHNLLRWIIVLLLVYSLVKAYAGWKGKKAFNPADKKTWLLTMIAAHITLLLGLYQVAMGRYGIFSYTVPEGISVMKDRFLRFFWVEHPVMMILAIVFITLGHGMAKKEVSDELKYKKAFLFFAIAMLLILAGVPWPFREIIGRPYFPGIAG